MVHTRCALDPWGLRKILMGPPLSKPMGPRIHFAHLRNTKRIAGSDAARPDFFEAPHLEGDTDMVGTVRALMAPNKHAAVPRGVRIGKFQCDRIMAKSCSVILAGIARRAIR